MLIQFCDVVLCVQIMSSSLSDLFQDRIGSFIQDLLDDLEVQEEYERYAVTIPSSFRVRFAAASTIINQDENSPGGRTNPIDLS